MALIAVAPNRSAFGVAGPEHAPPWPTVRPSRWDRTPCAVYQTIDISNVLEAVYSTDAHFVCYVVRGPGGVVLRDQPRINKGGLAYIRSLGYEVEITALAADIDNPGHAPWTPELMAEAAVQDRQNGTAALYYTAHGRRLLQPLERPIPVELAEGALQTWLAEQRALGFNPDAACTDWTRHYRLPHVRRNGADYRSPIVDLSRMRPIPAPAPMVAARLKPPPGKALGKVGDSPLGRAFAAAGWLGLRLSPGKVSVLCPWRALHSTGRDYDSSTVLFAPTAARRAGTWFCSHAHCQDRTQDDVVAALPPEARAVLHAAAPPRPDAAPEPRELVAPDVACERLEGAFRTAPPGLSVVVAGCGVGKTKAALQVAAERAAVPYATTSAKGARAPAHSKTAISVPTARLAREVAERARARGVAVRRIFGPLSERNPDDSPVCHYHDAAKLLAAGGLSIPWELCRGRDRNPCEHYETCTARQGADGPDDARVIIGPHALLLQLAGESGATGLLVIDEPPPLLSREILTAEEIREAVTALEPHFDRQYAAAMGPALLATAAWINSAPIADLTGPIDAAGPLTGALPVAAVDSARQAFSPEDKGRAPKLRPSHAFAARGAVEHARRIGAAARIARLIWIALDRSPGVTAHVELDGAGRRVLILTMADVALRDAMRREGATVVADAGGRLHLPLYERIVGYPPPVTEAHVGDGAPVARTWIRGRMPRRKLLPDRGRLDVAVLARALGWIVEWALEGPSADRLAIVTYRPAELALRAALGEDVAARWVKAGQAAGELAKVRARLEPLLARLPAHPQLGHFGALRGLDAWKGLDALVTLGDPRGPLDAARWEARFLDLDGWESRYAATAAAELEQAHGRLRTVHRTRPARALHVGEILPGGWVDFTVRDIRPGPAPRAAGPMAPGDLRPHVDAAGGVGAAADRWGIDRKTIQRYLSGQRAIPADLADRILPAAE